MDGNEWPPATLPADKSIKITLTAAEWEVVLNVLSTGIYRTVAPLMQKIAQQALPQPSSCRKGEEIDS